MNKNIFAKVAGMGLATSLALTVQSSAQAYDFSFEIDDGTTQVTGTIFGLSDGNSTPDRIEVDSPIVETYEVGVDGINEIGNFTVSLSPDPILTANDFALYGGSPFRQISFGSAYTNYSSGSFNVGQDTDLDYKFTSLTTPTAVPFGVSADLSIIILGGLYGVSRLRKTIAARKS